MRAKALGVAIGTLSALSMSAHAQTVASPRAHVDQHEKVGERAREHRGGAPDSAEAVKLQRRAKITIDSARAIALALVTHATVEKGWIEQEHGKLFYDLKLKVAGAPGLEEVHVSAINGRILERKHRGDAAKGAAAPRADATKLRPK